MTTDFADRYGPWAVVCGASDGTGAAFAAELAGRGLNVVVVARRQGTLADVAATLPTSSRLVVVDLSIPEAADQLVAATSDLDVGLFVYNAGADSHNTLFLDTSASDWLAMIQRNCATTLALCHAFGGRIVVRGRGGVVIVSSGAAFAGGSHLVTYGATKAFDMVLAEGLWAEWKQQGVDVLSLVLGATDTPSLRRSLETHGGDFGPLADPVDVARVTFDHIADGPTWIFGQDDPTGPSLLGSLPRRQAVELMSMGSAAMFGRRE